MWCTISRSRFFFVRIGRRSSDVLLDADDRALGSRGAILDVEGLALLMKLGALGDPPPAASAGLRSSGGETRKDDGPTAAEECHGWRALEHEVRLTIGLRYTGGRRGLYAEELAQALRELEEARYVERINPRLSPQV